MLAESVRRNCRGVNAALDYVGTPPAGNSPGNTNASKPGKGSGERQDIVWLKEGDFVRPVEVKVGTSDGSNTAVVASDLQEDQEVVTGETTDKAQTGTKNPFLPQLPPRR